MFSGLYSDLPEAKNTTDKTETDDNTQKSSWSGSVVPKPSTTRKTAAVFMPPPSLLRPNATPSTSTTAKPKPRTVNTMQSTTPHTSNNDGPNSTETPTTVISQFSWENILDEYDPSKPNDYDQILKKRQQQRLEAEAEAERQEKLRAQKAEEQTKKSIQLHISGEEAFNRRQARTTAIAMEDSPSGTMTTKTAMEATETKPKGGMDFAKKMLEKMGWKEGEGLGKNKQGMTAPLAVMKTDIRSGKIVTLDAKKDVESRKKNDFGSHTTTTNNSNNNNNNNNNNNGGGGGAVQSRVLMLRNIVLPGQVTESLDEEIGEECSKYGEVTNVLIFEVTQAGFPETEAVRVFVEFAEAEGARKAIGNLQGRFFGGRMISASYFDQERFDAEDLAPRDGERYY